MDSVQKLQFHDVQVEDFVVLGRPVCVLGLCDLPPLLIWQVRSDQIDLDKRFERLGLGPLKIVGSDDWKKREKYHLNKISKPLRLNYQKDQIRFALFQISPSSIRFCEFRLGSYTYDTIFNFNSPSIDRFTFFHPRRTTREVVVDPAAGLYFSYDVFWRKVLHSSVRIWTE